MCSVTSWPARLTTTVSVLAGGRADQGAQLVPARDLGAVDRLELVAQLERGESRRRRRVGRAVGAGGQLGIGRHDALQDGPDRRRLVLVRLAQRGEQDGEQDEEDQQVHARPAEHDDHLLARGQPVELAVLVGRVDLGAAHLAEVLDGAGEAARPPRHLAVRSRRHHADHADVAADRDALQPVLGVTALARPDGRPEPDHVLGDLHAELLGRHHVADLVQRDRRQQSEREDEDAERVQQPGRHGRFAPLLPAFRSGRPGGGRRGPRPVRGPARGPTPLRVRRPRRYPGSLRSDGDRSAIPPGRRRSCRRSAGTRSRRRGRRRPVPRWPRCRRPGRNRRRGRPGARDRRPGKPSASSGSKVQDWAAVQSTAAAAPGTRSGQPRARAIGSRMSGGDAWAMVEPSVNSTMEWITDCGWTTTSIRS